MKVKFYYFNIDICIKTRISVEKSISSLQIAEIGGLEMQNISESNTFIMSTFSAVDYSQHYIPFHLPQKPYELVSGIKKESLQLME